MERLAVNRLSSDVECFRKHWKLKTSVGEIDKLLFIWPKRIFKQINKKIIINELGVRNVRISTF